MPKENVALLAFNRGIISPLALTRTDIERTRFSAEVMTNWVPRVLGSMILRPGLQYITSTHSNAAARYIPFVFSIGDTGLIECTASIMRVLIDDALVTRAAVTSAVANAAFTSDVASWTDNDESGATSAWVTGGYLGLTGNGTNYAIRDQQVTTVETSTEHALTIVINRGPVVFRCGSTSGGDDYVSETSLETGVHSLAFTPTGDFHVQFKSLHKRQVLVDSCTVESSGIMTIATPWAASDIGNIRTDQSGDIIFSASSGLQQYKVERRAARSWSVVKYYTNDGPFLVVNVSTLTMTPSALTGNITVTASKSYFKSANVGSLFKITSTGQEVTASITTENSFTGTIKVTGVESSRIFTVIRSGIWSATVTLQRSLDSDSGPWEDVTTYTTNATVTFDDGLDNQIAWYRIGVKTGDYTANVITGATQANPCVITVTDSDIFSTGENIGISGVVGMTELNGNTYTVTKLTATTYELDSTNSTGYGAYGSAGVATSEGPLTATLDYAIGFVDGIVRITDYTNETTVSAEVIVDLGGTDATDDWAEGAWSDRRGWPTSVGFAEGRLGWSGADSVKLSVSDSFYSFDSEVEGDSGTINRSIGTGPVDTINWMLALERLILGAEGAEFVCKSSSFDEPLTPTDFSVKSASTQGSAGVEAIKIDGIGVYIQRGGTRVMEISEEGGKYGSIDLSLLVPEIVASPIIRMAAQRKPDTRIHCVRTDGKVVVLVFDRAENVRSWSVVETDGLIEDVVVLPGISGEQEDAVYYVVNRTISGSTKRYLEKWALESECVGGTLNKQADSFIVYSGAAVTTITGLDHLNDETVTVWGNGKDLGTYVVDSGSITGITEEVTDAIVGLVYIAQWKSAKLAYASGLGTALVQRKRVNHLGVILKDTHYQGLKYGPNFDTLDDLPLVEAAAATDADTIHASYDEDSFEFPGEWDTDSRLCLQATAPRPCNILAAIVGVETHDKY